MRRHDMDTIRLVILASFALVAVSCAALAAADGPSLPVGVVFLLLVVVGHFSGLYRYADVAAAILGIAAYGVLEQSQGMAGVLALLIAAVCFAATVASVRLVARYIQAVEAEQRRTQSMVDDLTMYDAASGLLKRRYGELALEEEVRRARRMSAPLSLVVAAPDPVPEHIIDLPPDPDIEAGVIGDILRDILRETDRMARPAPSTFLAILPATNAAGGEVVAQKLRRICVERGIAPLRCGVATFPDSALSAADLMEEALAALQVARHGGFDYVGPGMLAPLEGVQ